MAAKKKKPVQKTPAALDRSAFKELRMLMQGIVTPAEQDENDAVTGVLLKKYGLEDMAAWCLNHGLNIYDKSPLEIERFCIRGKMGNWQWALMQEVPKMTEADVFPLPTVHYPLFDYSNTGPVGHVKNFADIAWEGWIEWSVKFGPQSQKEIIQNHFLQRVMWDLTNRTQYCEQQTQYNMLCGPGSCGKTFAAALRALVLEYCFPRDCMVKVCSSSKGAAESRIWAELVQLHDKSIFGKGKKCWGGYFKLWSGGNQRLLFVEDSEKANDGAKDARRGIELVAIPRSAVGKGAVGALKGMRQLVKLLIVDEATDVDNSAFDPEMAGNWLEAQLLSQIVYLANPNHDSSAFVENYKAKEGEWYSEDSPGWETKYRGYVTNLNGLDTPNRHYLKKNDPERNPLSPPCPFPYVTNMTGINRLEKGAGGRNTCAFMSQAVGFLSSSELADNILTEHMIMACGANQQPEWSGEGVYPLIGADPAFGGDDFAIAVGEVGLGYCTVNGIREKRVLLNIPELMKVPRVHIDPTATITQDEAAATWVIDLCQRLGINHLSAIASDSTGISRGFVHLFENMAKTKKFQGTYLHRVGWKEKCSERPERPEDPSARKSSDAYPDSTSELIMAVREWRSYLRGFTDPELVEQFVKRKFHVATGNRYKVMTKDEFVKGVTSKKWVPYGKSPDKMDAVAVLVDLARQCGLGTKTLKHPNFIEEGGRMVIRRRSQGLYGQGKVSTEGWASIKAAS